MHLTHDSLHTAGAFLLPSSHASRKMPRLPLLAHNSPDMQGKPMILRPGSDAELFMSRT